MIYLDNNSTTQVTQDVLNCMSKYFSESYGNPGALYSLGVSAKEAVEESRKKVAHLLNCDPTQVFFTSGGTEGNNTIISGVIESLSKEGLLDSDTGILYSAVEHDSVRNSVKKMQELYGIYSDTLGVTSEGEVKYSELEDRIAPNIALVSVMMVNNETGTLNPVKGMAEICHDNGVLFHTDCVQAISSHRVDVSQIGCDFATISGHKIHAPKGIGAIYVKDPSTIIPLINGGAEQEFGMRGGTESVHNIVGFGKACEILDENIELISRTTTELKNIFYKSLCKSMKQDGTFGLLSLNGESPTSPGKTLNLTFDGVDGQSLVLMLDGCGVCVSAGSACRSHEADPSHVLLAMGRTAEEARSSIRVSFSKLNTEEEAYNAALIMSQCVKTLRSM